MCLTKPGRTKLCCSACSLIGERAVGLSLSDPLTAAAKRTGAHRRSANPIERHLVCSIEVGQCRVDDLAGVWIHKGFSVGLDVTDRDHGRLGLVYTTRDTAAQTAKPARHGSDELRRVQLVLADVR